MAATGLLLNFHTHAATVPLLKKSILHRHGSAWWEHRVVALETRQGLPPHKITGPAPSVHAHGFVGTSEQVFEQPSQRAQPVEPPLICGQIENVFFFLNVS